MTWEIDEEDLKRYLHFDKYIRIDDIRKLVTDEERVRKNSFYPFIKYETVYQPFRGGDTVKPDKKSREIRYASRRDAYIYSYYRYKIGLFYESEILRLKISDSVIAYRRIPIVSGGLKCKCNIDFAKEAFDFLSESGNCSAIVLDISKYFESIDHAKLYNIWCRLLGKSELPPDHEAVYKNITSYRVVEKDFLYDRLGYTKIVTKRGVSRTEYVMPFRKMPIQLCSNKDFREKVAGSSGLYPSLIKKNENSFGIPQGSPISDILANMYLIDFDVALQNYATSLGGMYRRYSDDILLLIPGDKDLGVSAKEFVKGEIERHGDQVKIHDRKCSVSYFEPDNGKYLKFTHVYGRKGKAGLEYLGFRFDGKRVYLRDGTVSSLFRKTSFAISKEAFALKKRYKGKSKDYLLENFNLEELLKKFGRVEDFDSSAGCKNWTFWTYTKRCLKVFKSSGLPIYNQIKGCKEFALRRMREELESQA